MRATRATRSRRWRPPRQGTILGGGTETVSSGGIASNTVTSGGGTLTVLAGGLADPTMIYSGGSEIFSAGGTDDGAQISGGTEVVSSGGTTINAMPSGGAVVLEAWPAAVSSLRVGGTLEIFGSAMPSAAISGFTSGGASNLASIALASGRTVFASGNVLEVAALFFSPGRHSATANSSG
jgi:autotransporter passenger strand-loop-strand repeat protein